MRRRDFLRALGLGTVAAAAPAVLTPERRMWFVPSSAPVGSGLESVTVPLRSGQAFRYPVYLGLPVSGGGASEAAHQSTLAGRLQLAEDMQRAGLLDPPEPLQLLPMPAEFRDALQAEREKSVSAFGGLNSAARGLPGTGIVDELRDIERELNARLANAIGGPSLVAALTGSETAPRCDTRT